MYKQQAYASGSISGGAQVTSSYWVTMPPKRMRDRVGPPRGGVVLREVYDMRDFPRHFFRDVGRANLTAFLRDVAPHVEECYGVFFGSSYTDLVQKAYFNFYVRAKDSNGNSYEFLSRRPFTEGGRHIHIKSVDMKSMATRDDTLERWYRLRLLSRKVGKIALFVRWLYTRVEAKRTVATGAHGIDGNRRDDIADVIETCVAAPTEQSVAMAGIALYRHKRAHGDDPGMSILQDALEGAKRMCREKGIL